MSIPRFALALAGALALTSPGHATLLLTLTAPASGGSAVLSDGSGDPRFLDGRSIFVTVDRGTITGAQWIVQGEETILWWDPFGGGVDENDEFVPALTGNNYTFSPECTVAAGGSCGGFLGLSGSLNGNVLRIDFVPPVDSYSCTPVFTGDTSNCAFSYDLYNVQFDIAVDAGDGDVVFRFADAPPGGVVPEPASWALLIAGFGLVGGTLRRRRVLPA